MNGVRKKGRKERYKLNSTGVFQDKPERDCSGTGEQTSCSHAGVSCRVMNVVGAGESSVKGGLQLLPKDACPRMKLRKRSRKRLGNGQGVVVLISNWTE